MIEETMSNSSIAVATVIDTRRALTLDDLKILARHLSDRLGKWDAAVLGGLLAPDLLKAAKGIEEMSRHGIEITPRCLEMDALCVAIRDAQETDT